MTSDYKYALQLQAEELAEEAGVDFSALPIDQQCTIYTQATEKWVDAQYARADAARDQE